MNIARREKLIPVSTIATGCIPFNRKQKARQGYKIGENPVKESGVYVESFDEALQKLRSMKCAGWRDYGNSSSAHKAIAWVSEKDAEMLLGETNKAKRVLLFESITDKVE